MKGGFRNYTAAFLAVSMLASSAATAAPRTVDPLVALSVFGTAESRAAVCAAGAQAAAAAGAAVAAQGAAGGCVLPAVDAPPPPAPASTEVIPPAGPVVASSGAAIWPLFLGLAAIAAIAAVVLTSDHHNGHIDLPVSP